MQLDQHFADQMGQLVGPDFPEHIAVAVSGGGDSMAMLHLAAGWARRFGISLWPVTIDHGLRPESADEAKLVAEEAAGLGLPHSTLTWSWDGQGNLQDAARQARLDLICRWRGPCRHVLMAHTMDDQAETVLIRLLRGSGVDGLAGIAPTWQIPGLAQCSPLRTDGGPPPPTDGVNDGRMTVVRPFLDVSRADLRRYLSVLKIPFVDDPSNTDERFARVRMRNLIASEGFDVRTLADTAKTMRRAKAALNQRACDVADQIKSTAANTSGHAGFNRDGLAQIEAETRLRLVADAIMEIGGSRYRPRLAALEGAVDVALSGGKTTLAGCLLMANGSEVIICREFNAVAATHSPTDALWDGRWALAGPFDPALEIRALGENGLAQLPDWRATDLIREVLLPSPAVWQADTLIAAPVAGHKAGWVARIVPPQDRNTVPH